MNTIMLKIRPVFTAICTLAILFFVSCTDGFEKLNTDSLNPPYAENSDEPEEPEEPQEGKYADINLSTKISDEELHSLKENIGGIGAVFKKFTYEGLVNDYQRTTNLTHDIYCRYFANNKPDFINNSPNYVYTEDWSGRRWNHFYKERTAEYKMLARTFRHVDKKAYNNAFYIARIYYAFLGSTMTDTYGAIPFGIFAQAKKTPEKVPYESQKEVYDKIFRMLEQAVDSIIPGASSFQFDPADDKCYGGDEEKWLRFANTLRLRLALRISNIDPERARKEGEAALANPYGIMRSQADRLRTIPNYAPVSMGGENAGGNENDVANCSFRYTDAVMSKDLEEAYKNLSNVIDPRCGICWFRPTPKNILKEGREDRSKKFSGCEVGNNNIYHVSDVYSILRVNHWESKSMLRNDYWFGYSREYIWLGYAECKFLQAEAALRGWTNAGGSPEQLLEEGIRESMKYYHLPAMKANTYINGLKGYPFNASNKEAFLEQIITQKWLAVFPNGNEGWAEFRRTDYPRFRNHLNNRDANIPIGKFIKRVQYPFSEYKNNPDNVPPLTTINQSSRLWWDVQDTNNNEGKYMQPNNFR